MVTGAVGYVVWVLKERHKHRSTSVEEEMNEVMLRKNAVVAVLRQVIIHTHHEATSRGWTTSEEVHGMISCYSAYKDLGGNGHATALVENFNRLPIRGEHNG